MKKSCLYVGQVRHRRFTPKQHQFSYKLFLVYLDLSELTSVFDRFWLWSIEKTNIATFRRKDHLGDKKLPLDTSVRNHIEDETGRRPQGPIRLLTHLSYFGFRFNPVSFYYCYDENDEKLEFIVAEVNNTPWGENTVTYWTPGTTRTKAARQITAFIDTTKINAFMFLLLCRWTWIMTGVFPHQMIRYRLTWKTISMIRKFLTPR